MYLSLAGSQNGLSAYGEAIKQTLKNHGDLMNAMMDSTGRLPVAAATDARDRLRKLNADLVNNLILKEDSLSDDEAAKELSKISNGLFEVQKIFRQNQVQVEPLPPTPSYGSGVATIPASEAKALLTEYPKALETHTSLTERYPKLRNALTVLSAVPFVGPYAAQVIAKFDGDMKWLSDNVIAANDLFKKVPEFITAAEKSAVPGTTPMVNIGRGAYDLMRTWSARVFSTDNAFKQWEGKALKKPVAVTMTLPLIGEVSRPAGIAISVGAAATVGTGLFFLLRSMLAAPPRGSASPAMAGHRRRRRR